MRKVLLFALTTLIFQSCINTSEKKLPILGEREPVEKTVDGKLLIDTIYQTVPAFSYFNQDSIPVTNKDFDNKIYITDFFFTSCNTICPIMHRNSHTIDIKYDLPSKLKSYATKLGIEGNQWEFVHGSRDSIFGIAAKSYLVAAFEDSNDPQGLVHQGWFILVDTKKQLRGAYDGTKEDQVNQLMIDIELLLKEEFGNEK